MLMESEIIKRIYIIIIELNGYINQTELKIIFDQYNKEIIMKDEIDIKKNQKFKFNKDKEINHVKINFNKEDNRV